MKLGIKARNDSSSLVKYGECQKYETGSKKYPCLYLKENGSGIDTDKIKKNGINSSHNGYETPTNEESNEAERTLKVTQTAYHIDIPMEYFFNGTAYNSIFHPNKSQWVASRCVSTFSSEAQFGIYIINYDYIDYYNFFTSRGGSGYDVNCIRPIISLDSNIKITPHSGKKEDMHTIET